MNQPSSLPLALAIPVHDDRDGLLRLLTRVARLDCVAQVVVVDDGSQVPLVADELRAAWADDLTLLRHDLARGPGPARNAALEKVTGDHVLFIDADDLPTPELPLLLRDLATRDFDFCLFQYHDTRQEQALLWGQMPWDQAIWREAHVATGALNSPAPGDTAHLVRCANYPWNKIYRTAFLRDHAIGCSDILLHEDVELHWRSFLHADTILTSDRIGVIHFVDEKGSRLTNRSDAERLAVFGPLARIATEIAAEIATEMETGANPGKRALLAPPFARFAAGLIAWIADNIDPQHREALNVATRAFLCDQLPPAISDEITRADPDLVARARGPAA